VAAAEGEHVPAMTVLQFMHVPGQVELQHTPSVQKPLWHSLAPPHPAPGPFFSRQFVPLQ
jgi:hypothetical protein